MIFGSRPDLAGGYVADLQIQGRTIRFWIEDIRCAGLVWVATLALGGVTRVSSKEPRLADDAYDFHPMHRLYRMAWRPGSLEMECSYPTGPGDASYPTYRIHFASSSCAIRPSLGRTLRYSAGFYPLQRDLLRRPLGEGSRGGPIAAVNALLAAQAAP